MTPAQPSEQAALTAAKLQAGAVPALQLHGWNPKKPPLPHQLSGIAWAYLTPKSIVGDSVGCGKTGLALGLFELLKEKGQLTHEKGKRGLVVAPASAILGSWLAAGFQDFVPGMRVVTVQDKTKKQRLKVYQQTDWEVLVVSYGAVVNDLEHLKELGFVAVVADEADALGNHTSQRTKAFKEVVQEATWVCSMTATPTSGVSLMPLHSILDAMGVKDFGSKTWFERYYHVKVRDHIWIKRNGVATRIPVWRIESVKNGAEFKQGFKPFFLRRTRKDVGAKMPELLAQVKLLDMHPKQRAAYELAKQGFVQLGPHAPKKELKSAFNAMRQISTTTAFLDEGTGPDISAKMDWLIEQLSPGGDFESEKAVVFSQWLLSVDCFARRLEEAGIGHVKITGAVNQSKREEMRQKFWNDPTCRVVVGTSAIEKSLNLQVARLQVNIDQLHVPKSGEQLAGRVQRAGSLHEEAWVFSLLSRDTIDEKIYKNLQQKQGLADYVLDADSEVFESLTPMELYEIVRS